MSLLPLDLQSLSPDTPIELFEVWGFNLSAPNETLRFCNYQNVTFENQAYLPLGCESSGFDLIGQGPIAQPTVSVSNIGRTIGDWLYRVKNTPNHRLLGATVKRRITQKQFLDGQVNAIASIRELPYAIFVIDQIEEETYKAVRFKLGSPFDVEGVTLPARFASRTCAWIYRSAECGWTGGMYTAGNSPTIDPNQDRCAKSLRACEIRFGQNSLLPFGGFPGLENYGS